MIGKNVQWPPTLAQMETILGGSSHQNGLLSWIFTAFTLLFMQLTYPAFAVGLGDRSIEKIVEVGDWMAPVWRRFSRLLGLFGLWMLAFSAFVVIVLIAMIPFWIAAITFRFPLLNVVVLTLMMMPLVPLGEISFAWSAFISVFEDRNALAAMRGALALSLNRRRFWRTCGISAALIVLRIAVNIPLHAGAAYVFFWTKSPILYAGLYSAVEVPLLAFSALVTASYYFDTRLREAIAASPVAP